MKIKDILNKNRILVSLFFSMFFFLLLVAIYSFSLKRNIKVELFSSLKRDATYIYTKYNDVCRQNIETAKNAGYTTAVQKTLFSENAGEKIDNMTTARELISSVKDQNQYITDLFFYSDGGHLYTTSEYYSSFRSDMESYKFDRKIMLDHSFMSANVIVDGKAQFFFVYTPIYRTAAGISHNNNDSRGVCAILCNFSNLLKDMEELLDDNSANYLLYKGTVISSFNAFEGLDTSLLEYIPEGEGEYILGESGYMAYTIPFDNWSIVCLASNDINVIGNLYQDKTIYILLSITIMIFAVIIYWLFKQDMLKRENEVQKELLAATIAQQEAEMSAYRSQINPHFFFNTLECVRSMAQYYQVDEIEDIVTAMSKTFRYSLYSEMIVDFYREIDMLDYYFIITSYRFPDRYVLNKDIDESALNFRVPSMILQPLVENAIKHGFKELKIDQQNTVTVSAKVNEQGLLVVSVKDNGCGMSIETLSALIENNTSADSSIVSAKDSIGIRNIYERIKLFNPDNSMSFFSEEGKYTEVLLELYPAVLPGKN